MIDTYLGLQNYFTTVYFVYTTFAIVTVMAVYCLFFFDGME